MFIGNPRGSWLASAAFPGPPLIAAAAAVIVAASPWLSRPWRRAAWLTLLVVAVVRLVTGTVLPMELVIAIATGVTVGAAVLVVFGVPDRRMGPDEIADALRRAGVPVGSVWPAGEAKGSRPFGAATRDGRLFIKVLGSDQRDADLKLANDLHEKALGILKASDINWTYFSPAGYFEAGERTGKFRLGTTNLIANEKGDSRISFEDYAVALVDEIETPAHERGQLSIGY